MADIGSDGDDFLGADKDSEEELEATARVLDITRRQCTLITQSCSLIGELLDDDDDRMGDQQDGDHSVDPLRGTSTILKRCPENLTKQSQFRFILTTFNINKITFHRLIQRTQLRELQI